VSIIDSLCSHVANVNASFSYGFTPLHIAVTYPCSEVFTMLLEFGADPYMETKDGQNAMYMAAGQHNYKNVDDIFGSWREVPLIKRCGVDVQD